MLRDAHKRFEREIHGTRNYNGLARVTRCVCTYFPLNIQRTHAQNSNSNAHHALRRKRFYNLKCVKEHASSILRMRTWRKVRACVRDLRI